MSPFSPSAIEAAPPCPPLFNEAVALRVARLADALGRRGAWLRTAESCTGGMVAAACTDRAGSSAWFDSGLVTYSNAAKIERLGVAPELLEAYGAVSEAVARAMAEGAWGAPSGGAEHPTDHAERWSISVTGIAGPDGGTPAKPVGTVWFAWCRRVGSGAAAQTWTECLQFPGDRAAVRQAAVQAALDGLLQRLTALR